MIYHFGFLSAMSRNVLKNGGKNGFFMYLSPGNMLKSSVPLSFSYRCKAGDFYFKKKSKNHTTMSDGCEIEPFKVGPQMKVKIQNFHKKP